MGKFLNPHTLLRMGIHKHVGDKVWKRHKIKRPELETLAAMAVYMLVNQKTSIPIRHIKRWNNLTLYNEFLFMKVISQVNTLIKDGFILQVQLPNKTHTYRITGKGVAALNTYVFESDLVYNKHLESIQDMNQLDKIAI